MHPSGNKLIVMMKIKWLLVFAACVITAACPGQGRKAELFQIDGYIRGLGNDSLLMFISNVKNADRSTAADTLVVVGYKDRFSIQGAAIPQLVWVRIGGRRSVSNFSFFLEQGRITINGAKDSSDNIAVTGTPENDLLTMEKLEENRLYDRMKRMRAQLQQAGKDENQSGPLYSAINALYDSINTVRIAFIRAHPNAMASTLYLSILQDCIAPEAVEQLYAQLGTDAKNNEFGQRVKSRIEGRRRSAEGKPAPEFASMDTSGRAIKLSDFRGKYVLLDFWASWCVPCRKENPFLLEAFNRFRDKGFIIISISMDHVKESWLKAIVQDRLNWVHLSELNGLDNKVARLYGVQPIPDNFLIDPEGRIVARKLYGKDIEKKLAELMMVSR
jgi:peroxiredoxin